MQFMHTLATVARLPALLTRAVGHWLGLDTHDSSSMSHDRPLEPGQQHSSRSTGDAVQQATSRRGCGDCRMQLACFSFACCQ